MCTILSRVYHVIPDIDPARYLVLGAGSHTSLTTPIGTSAVRTGALFILSVV